MLTRRLTTSSLICLLLGFLTSTARAIPAPASALDGELGSVLGRQEGQAYFGLDREDVREEDGMVDEALDMDTDEEPCALYSIPIICSH